MKKFIYNKTFLKELEKFCKKSDWTVEKFKTELWCFLCYLKWNEILRIYNQLPKIGYYKDNKVNNKTNIGNVYDLILLNILGSCYESCK